MIHFLKKIKKLFDAQNINRKTFLRIVMSLTSISFLYKFSLKKISAQDRKLKPRKKKIKKTKTDLVVVQGDDPVKITEKALEALGGINRFVNTGDIVVIKPNISWNRSPEFAANTNPQVVSSLVKLCLNAGAKEVRVFDRSCNNARMSYSKSGIRDAVKKAGGKIYHTHEWKFHPGEFREGSLMSNWLLFRDAVECDCFINVPVAKHHSLTGLTLSMKNLMGICGGSRGNIHIDINKKLAELTDFINPDLTVIDAFRILVRHGPSGGSLSDVLNKKTIIAGTDPVLADSYAASLFNFKPHSIGYIREGEKMGLGSMDLKNSKIRKIKI